MSPLISLSPFFKRNEYFLFAKQYFFIRISIILFNKTKVAISFLLINSRVIVSLTSSQTFHNSFLANLSLHYAHTSYKIDTSTLSRTILFQYLPTRYFINWYSYEHALGKKRLITRCWQIHRLYNPYKPHFTQDAFRRTMQNCLSRKHGGQLSGLVAAGLLQETPWSISNADVLQCRVGVNFSVKRHENIRLADAIHRQTMRRIV